MNQLNSIILEGNVVRKAEMSEPTAGFLVCRFPIAVNRKTKTPDGEPKEEVSFFDVETYGEMAEKCSKYCDKGKGVRVVGRLKQSRWEDNNVKRSKVFVIAEHVEYKFSKPKAEDEKQQEEVKTSEVPETSEAPATETTPATEAQAQPVVF